MNPKQKQSTLSDTYFDFHLYTDIYHHNFYLIHPRKNYIVTDYEIKDFIENRIPGNCKYLADQKDFAARTVSYSHPESGLLIIVALRSPWTNSPDDHGRLAHEISHATALMMEDVGTPHHIDYSDESYAYLTEHLTSEFVRHLQNYKYGTLVQRRNTRRKL